MANGGQNRKFKKYFVDIQIPFFKGSFQKKAIKQQACIMTTFAFPDVALEQKIPFDRYRKRKKYLEWSISKNIGRAVADYQMIQDGDKILVCVSGKKADLALLKILFDRKAFVPIRYEILVVYLDQGGLSDSKDFLVQFFKERNYSFVIKKRDDFKKEQLSEKRGSRNSHGSHSDDIFFKIAESMGCCKVALSEHKDDVVQRTLENLLFRGTVESLAPLQEVLRNKLTLIRPLIYVEKREIEEWAELNQFTSLGKEILEPQSSQQRAIEKIIDQVLKNCPSVKTNISRSLKRIKKDYLL